MLNILQAFSSIAVTVEYESSERLFHRNTVKMAGMSKVFVGTVVTNCWETTEKEKAQKHRSFSALVPSNVMKVKGGEKSCCCQSTEE